MQNMFNESKNDKKMVNVNAIMNSAIQNGTAYKERLFNLSN